MDKEREITGYTSPVYTKAVNEYFDYTDDETRHSLLGINESDQSKVLISLTGRLYEDIVHKVDNIDYGEIPYTKGDITKLNTYERMKDCVKVMKEIMVEYKQPITNNIDVIEKAMQNIEDRKDLFVKGYLTKSEFPILVYNSLVISVAGALSFMIASCIDFIKDSDLQGFETTVNKMAVAKTEQHMMFVNLKKFNNSCKSGDFDKALNFVMNKNVENLVGPGAAIAVGGAIVAAGILLNIIPLLREIIYFYYYTRVKISDYFTIQADLLQMNAYNLDKNKLGKTDAEVKQIVKRQMMVVEEFRKISNFINVEYKNAEKSATKEIVADSKKKYKASDVLDSAPDSSATSSGLF